MKRIIGIPWARKDKDGNRPPKPQKPPPPGLTDIVAKTDAKADDLEKKVTACETELKKLSIKLKSASGSTKDNLLSKANAILQRKKRFEQQIETMRQQSFNMEQTSVTLDATKDASVTVKAMKQAVKDLKKEQKKVNVDSVEDLHDELEQLFEASDDVQEVLANKINLPEIDDQELEEQLELLQDDFVADNDTSYLDLAAEGKIPDDGITASGLMPGPSCSRGRSRSKGNRLPPSAAVSSSHPENATDSDLIDLADTLDGLPT